MANKYLRQFLYSKHPMLTLITGSVTFGAAGAVSASSGAGLKSVTKLGTGLYQIKLVDSFPSFIGYDSEMLGGVTGAAINDGSFVAGTLYQIVTVGNTNWTAVGFDSDYTPVVGALFVATGVGGAGTGQVKAIAPSAVQSIEIAQNPASMLKNLNQSQGKGSSLILSLYNSSGAAGAQVLGSPASGAQMIFKLMFKNSSVASL